MMHYDFTPSSMRSLSPRLPKQIAALRWLIDPEQRQRNGLVRVELYNSKFFWGWFDIEKLKRIRDELIALIEYLEGEAAKP